MKGLMGFVTKNVNSSRQVFRWRIRPPDFSRARSLCYGKLIRNAEHAWSKLLKGNQLSRCFEIEWCLLFLFVPLIRCYSTFCVFDWTVSTPVSPFGIQAAYYRSNITFPSRRLNTSTTNETSIMHQVFLTELSFSQSNVYESNFFPWFLYRVVHK